MLLPHNNKVFNAAKDKLLKDKHIGIVQATGTGKSYVTAELIKAVGAHKVLYIIPKNIIEEDIGNIEDYQDFEVKFMNYTYLCNYLLEVEVNKLAEEYDIVIFDEAHHLGAPTWKNPCHRLMTKSKYSIALTATPIRMDTGDNIVEEFHGAKDTLYGLSLEEAVATKVLPQFHYYAVADVATRHAMLMKGEIDVISYIKSVSTVSSNIRSYTQLAKGKWLVFCSSIAELTYTKQNVQKWFDYEVTICDVHSGKTAKKNKEELERFNSSEGGAVLLCVDMINEGLHIKGIVGSIMLRKTTSPTVFEQQLGRSLAAGSDIVPIIIDVIGNYDNLRYARDVVERIHKRVAAEKKKGATLTVIDEYLVTDATLVDIENIWKARPNRSMAEHILKEYYKVEGTKAFKRVTGLTRAECRAIVRKLKLKFSNRWTPEEIETLKQYYPKEGSTCHVRLNHRTASAASAKASALGLRKERRKL